MRALLCTSLDILLSFPLVVFLFFLPYDSYNVPFRPGSLVGRLFKLSTWGRPVSWVLFLGCLIELIDIGDAGSLDWFFPPSFSNWLVHLTRCFVRPPSVSHFLFLPGIWDEPSCPSFCVRRFRLSVPFVLPWKDFSLCSSHVPVPGIPPPFAPRLYPQTWPAFPGPLLPLCFHPM